MTTDKTAAIIVTRNRKELLLNCLNAIRAQTVLPSAVYIVDNHSGDGTADILRENNYISAGPSLNNGEGAIFNSTRSPGASLQEMDITYVYKPENTGGAGGFYTGMKMAFDAGYDWFWMMDDDGLPSETELENLSRFSKKYDLFFSNAVVLDINDRETLSFEPLEKNKKHLADYTHAVYGAIHPFNGTFIHRTVPRTIGFVKKEMFIWGDEQEYSLRAKEANFLIATIIQAVHYHPREKGVYGYALPLVNKGKILIKPEKLSPVYYRNLGFLYAAYRGIRKRTLLKYFLYYFTRLKYLKLIRYVKAFLEGYRDEYLPPPPPANGD